MKTYSTERIRNISLIGAKGVGKSSLAEALLFSAHITTRLGKVDEGNTVVDYDPLEVAHKQSLSTAALAIEWKDCKVNFLDTPGYSDFIGESLASLWVSDVACLVMSAGQSDTVETRKFYNTAEKFKKPLCFFANRLDSSRANWSRTWNQIHTISGGHAVLFNLPWGESNAFKGIVDLLEMKAYAIHGEKVEEVAIPKELEEEAKKQRIVLLETAAETNEALMEKYLDKGELTQEEMTQALAQGINQRDYFPVFVGSARQNVGALNLLNSVVSFFPSPSIVPSVPCRYKGETKRLDQNSEGPIAAQIFKITSDSGLGEVFYLKIFSGSLKSGMDVANMNKGGSERVGHIFVMRGKERLEIPEAFAGDIIATAKLKQSSIGDTLTLKKEEIQFDSISFPKPVISFALHVESRQEQDKLGLGMSRLMAVDPTFRMFIDKEFAETIVSGMGEQHIDVIIERIKKQYGISPTLGSPHIPYRETLTKVAQGQGKYKKQTGGHGQYGDCWIRLEPLPRGSGFEFASEIVGGSIPSKYIPSIEKGIREALNRGILAGYKVVDFKAVVYDGSYHDVDSSDLAFQVAASMAFKKVQEEARPQLLEPVMSMEVTVPSQYVGDITNDIATRRGRIQTMENMGDVDCVKCLVPMAELYKYSTSLRSVTHGSGSYSMSFSHYDPVPPHAVAKIVEEAKKEREEKAK